MVYSFFKDVRGKKYRLLLDFLFERSDTFTFMFPQYHNGLVTKENYDMVSDGKYEIGEHFSCFDKLQKEEQDRYCEYYNKNLSLLQKLEPDLINTVETTCYGGQITAYVCLTKVYKCSENALNVLQTGKSLFSWFRGELPCDLCFYKNGLPILETVAHESEGWLYLDDADAETVQELGVKIEESINQYEPDLVEYLLLQDK